MKIKKQYLRLEEENSEINVGLVRLIKPVPDHELFFSINNINTFKFKRIEDIKISGQYFDHFFSRFEAYDKMSKSCYRIISNKSIYSEQTKKNDMLFIDEYNVKFLINHLSDVDFILTSSDMFADFSLILLPEKFLFQIQDYDLNPVEDLYKIIQYYE